ncbi:MAG TPA: hypothetical protein VHB98_21445 [Chloroflexota bacterium]|jgi:hypothetical protein|nr:hypothetical protein [Chloroflexota bacterium]
MQQTISRRMLGRLAVTVLAVVAALAPAVVPAAAAAGFTVVSSPNVGTTNDNQFNAVAVLSPTNVWAVGHFTATVAPPNLRSIVEHFDGTRWSVVTNPHPNDEDRLNGIAADSASDVWAVGLSATNAGTDFPLVEHFNGTSWSQVTVPNPGTQIVLRGVAAISPTNVWIVGFANVATPATFIEHFDGTAWSIVPSPNPANGGLLAAITAISPTDIWAVGSMIVTVNGVSFREPLTEHWDGMRWSIVAPPPTGQGDLLGSAASSSSDVWAVGVSGGNQLIEHWNGSQWSIVTAPSPNDTSLNAVTVLGPADAWAVGDGNFSGAGTALIEHWDGSAWRVVTSPTGSEDGYLSGVSSLSGGLVWAVGNQIPNTTTFIVDTLALRDTAG